MRLCINCQAFDIQAFSRRQHSWVTTELAAFEAGDQEGCLFCKVIVEWHQSTSRPRRIFPQQPRWVHWTSGRLVNETPRGAQEPRDSYGLGIGMLLLRISDDPRPSLYSGGSTAPLVFNLHADPDSPAATSGDVVGLPSADPDPSSASECQRIQDWLTSCESHQKCTTTLSLTREIHKDCSPLPTRCVRVSLSEASSSASQPVHVALEETRGKTGSYLCLSHRWCQSETERTRTMWSNYQERQAGSGFENLEPLFLDVFLVAGRIGIEYVWIDSLCIIQDSPEDWITEADKMSDYYQNAVLTIMAAIPLEKRAQGLFHLPENHIYKLYRLPYRNTTGTRDGYFYLSSQFDQLLEQGRNVQGNELLSRGWVFQEWVLSRRIAWYTEQGIILQCKCQEAERWSASSVDLDPNPGIGRLLSCLNKTWFKFERYAGNGFPILSGPICWHTIASRYSSMKLSKPWKDRLIALNGVAQEYAAQEGKGTLVCGLRPWCFDLDLLWEQKEGGIHSRLDRFPTWSWASIDTSVVWADVQNFTALMELKTITSTAGKHSQTLEIGAGAGAGTTTDRGERNISPSGGLVTLPHHKRALAGQEATVSQAPEASLNTLHIRGRLLPVIFGSILDRPSENQFRLVSHYACRSDHWPSREVQRRTVALMTEQGAAIAGWSSLEEPDLHDDQAFIPTPLIFALFISVSTVYREENSNLRELYGKEEIFNVLFIRPSGTLTNGFVRVGMGRLFGSNVLDELGLSHDRDIVLL